MNFSFEKRKREKLAEEGARLFLAGEYASAWSVFEQVLLRDEDHFLANTLGAGCHI